MTSPSVAPTAVVDSSDAPPRACAPALRVVVADDHPLARRDLVRALTADGRLAVVGEAADGQAAVDLVLELHPDVALLDIRMPGVDGIEALRRIRAAGRVPVVLCSAYADPQYREVAERLGAGFVAKSAAESDIIAAVVEAAADPAVSSGR